MKRIQLTIIFILISLLLAGQELERVYITTDRSCYVAGEDILMSLFCFDASGDVNALSTLSKIAYVELQSSKGTVRTSKVALDGGRGGGMMTIFPDLPTGHYALFAYTSQNAAQEGFVPYVRIITIFNPLSTARSGEVVIRGETAYPQGGVPVGAAASGDRTSDAGGVTVLNYAEYETLDEGILSIRNGSGEAVSFTVSVFADDSLGAVDSEGIGVIAAGWKNQKGRVSEDYIPEYEGEIMELEVSGDVYSESPLSFSFPGSEPDLFFGKTDGLGKVSVYTGNIFGEKDMVCELHSADSAAVWDIKLKDPFIRKPFADLPPLVLDPSMAERITKRSVAMQLFRRFHTDTLYETAPFRHHTVLADPDRTYRLDDYTRFPQMTEVLTEYVQEMAVRTRDRKPYIQMWVRDVDGQAFFSNYSPLILIDGMPVTDYSAFLAYDPLLVSSLDIFSAEVLFSGIPFGGVANFRTYKSNLTSWNFGAQSRILKFEGASLPVISRFQDDRNPGVGYRYTLYWNPLMELESGKDVSVKVRMPSYPGSFKVCIEGVTASGKPFSTGSSFIVSSSKSSE